MGPAPSTRRCFHQSRVCSRRRDFVANVPRTRVKSAIPGKRPEARRSPCVQKRTRRTIAQDTSGRDWVEEGAGWGRSCGRTLDKRVEILLWDVAEREGSKSVMEKGGFGEGSRRGLGGRMSEMHSRSDFIRWHAISAAIESGCVSSREPERRCASGKGEGGRRKRTRWQNL